MARSPSRFRRGVRIVQLGMAFGVLALFCEVLISRPFILAVHSSPGLAFAIAAVFLGNFSLLVATPLLITVAALAIEVSPWRLAIASQLFILATRWAIWSVVQGPGAIFTSFFAWGVPLLAASVGVILSGIGYDKVATYLKARQARPPASAQAPPPNPTVAAPSAADALAPSSPPPSPDSPTKPDAS